MVTWSGYTSPSRLLCKAALVALIAAWGENKCEESKIQKPKDFLYMSKILFSQGRSAMNIFRVLSQNCTITYGFLIIL